MVLARIFPHGVRDRSRFGSVANATPKMPVDPVESMQYRSLFNQSFVDFVADLPTEEQCAPFKKLMKAYLKKDIPKGDDDRYHGDDKRAAQILDTVVDAQLLAEKRIHHSQEAFERDCLKAKEWREHPMELHKLEPLTDFSDAARVLYTSRSLHEVGLRLFAEGSIVKAVGFFAAALRHSELPMAWTLETREAVLAECLKISADEKLPRRLRADAAFVALLPLASTDLSRALQLARTAQELAPESAAVFAVKGNLHNTRKEFAEALRCMDKAALLGSQLPGPPAGGELA